jgi:uncharacterized protein (DUF924 family)
VIANHWDEYTVFEKLFLCMPLQHTETVEDQKLSVETFNRISNEMEATMYENAPIGMIKAFL